ncbi:MAG: helicase-related protein, partial [Rhizobiaceae bacterium]
GFNAAALHGDMDQPARMAALDSFRTGGVALLIASDVAARGLDIPDVSHVFNFDVPTHAEDYVHRIGRTGRAGRAGKAFTIVTRSDGKYLDAIEKLIGQDIAWQDGDLSTLEHTSDDVSHDRRKPGRRDDKGRKPRSDRGVGRDNEMMEKSTVVPAEDVEERRARKAAIKNGNTERRGAPSHQSERTKPHRGSRTHEEANTTVGFGDDVPAFMKVAVKV